MCCRRGGEKSECCGNIKDFWVGYLWVDRVLEDSRRVVKGGTDLEGDDAKNNAG